MIKKKQYYFMYNNLKIETGTILKIKPWYGCEEIIFEWYVPDGDMYVFKYKGKNGIVGSGMRGDEFRQYLLCPTNKKNESVVREHQIKMESNQLTLGKELQIDGLFFGWMWYLVLMGITFIFNGFYFYWAAISFCFFVYRYGKLKEEGYK